MPCTSFLLCTCSSGRNRFLHKTSESTCARWQVQEVCVVGLARTAPASFCLLPSAFCFLLSAFCFLLSAWLQHAIAERPESLPHDALQCYYRSRRSFGAFKFNLVFNHAGVHRAR